MPKAYYGQLFRTAVWLLKHFLLAVFGLLVFVALTGTLGVSHFTWMILSALGPWMIRSAVFVACFMGVAVVMESIRQ